MVRNEMNEQRDALIRLADDLQSLSEHIEIDHEVLKLLWYMHRPAYEGNMYCREDGFMFPCRTIRTLQGERFE